jgi:hypothetical protein
MNLVGAQSTLLATYLNTFSSLLGDKRTDRAFRGTVQGIIGAESLVCSRIAAFSPCARDGEPQWRAAGAADG